MRISRRRAFAVLGLALLAAGAACSGCSDGICTGEASCTYNSGSSGSREADPTFGRPRPRGSVPASGPDEAERGSGTAGGPE
jgi:hypothetical protein